MMDEKPPTEDRLPSRDTNESHLNRPYFILHVGQMKTGTTTIQCALRGTIKAQFQTSRN